MARALNREKLLEAFDEIGRAAVAAGTRLQIAVYGGSALMLASNFRFATEDVDVSELDQPLPDWLRNVTEKIARANGWADDWFNDGVVFHLSALADPIDDHLEFGTFVSPDGLHMNDWSYACMAKGLGNAIAEAAQRPIMSATNASHIIP